MQGTTEIVKLSEKSRREISQGFRWFEFTRHSSPPFNSIRNKIGGKIKVGIQSSGSKVLVAQVDDNGRTRRLGRNGKIF